MSPLSPPVCKVAAHKRCESKVRWGTGVSPKGGGAHLGLGSHLG